MPTTFQTRLHSVLGHGYLPIELPPPFSAKSYADAIIWDPGLSKTTILLKPPVTRLETHRIPRGNGGRRRLSIPNPLSYSALAHLVTGKWQLIASHMRQSAISSGPTVWNPKMGRALVPSKRHAELATLRTKVRSKSRYVVKTDISQFYHSIYTHSIPWSLYGKPYAKQNRFAKNLGNSLDSFVRALQDGQTVGIPVGPDCSLVIAETVLVGADLELIKEIPNFNGFRHVDDYEVGCNSYSEAEAVVSTIQKSLDAFDLEMNPLKTSIASLPEPLEPSWVTELRRFEFRDRISSQHQDIIDFFDCAFRWINNGEGRAVLIYALNKLSSADILKDNWTTTQRLIAQTALNDPSVIYNALYTLLRQITKGHVISPDLVGETLNSIIQDSAIVGHSNEVAWALWGLMRLNLRISAETAKVIAKMDDSVIALLALDARDRKLIDGHLVTSNWESYCRCDELEGDKWLLAYESNVKNWLQPSNDYVAQHPTFKLFKSAHVSFYDRTMVSNVRLTGASRVAGIHPLFSI